MAWSFLSQEKRSLVSKFEVAISKNRLFSFGKPFRDDKQGALNKLLKNERGELEGNQLRNVKNSIHWLIMVEA